MSNETYVRFFVEDGSTSFAVDVHNADTVYVPKEADSIVSFDVFSVSGVPLDITDKTVTMTVKRRPTDTVFVAKINATIQSPSPSCYGFFVLQKSLWTLIPAGMYVYEVFSEDLLGNRTQLSSAKVFHLGY